MGASVEKWQRGGRAGGEYVMYVMAVSHTAHTGSLFALMHRCAAIQPLVYFTSTLRVLRRLCFAQIFFNRSKRCASSSSGLSFLAGAAFTGVSLTVDLSAQASFSVPAGYVVLLFTGAVSALSDESSLSLTLFLLLSPSSSPSTASSSTSTPPPASSFSSSSFDSTAAEAGGSGTQSTL